tara:strand:+ start:400 stop:558 length:159 start_codon:yes stop_codon:yes gene_type:complete
LFGGGGGGGGGMSSPSLQQACSSISSSVKFSGLHEKKAELRITENKIINILI